MDLALILSISLAARIGIWALVLIVIVLVAIKYFDKKKKLSIKGIVPSSGGGTTFRNVLIVVFLLFVVFLIFFISLGEAPGWTNLLNGWIVVFGTVICIVMTISTASCSRIPGLRWVPWICGAVTLIFIVSTWSGLYAKAQAKKEILPELEDLFLQPQEAEEEKSKATQSTNCNEVQSEWKDHSPTFTPYGYWSERIVPSAGHRFKFLFEGKVDLKDACERIYKFEKFDGTLKVILPNGEKIEGTEDETFAMVFSRSRCNDHFFAMSLDKTKYITLTEKKVYH